MGQKGIWAVGAIAFAFLGFILLVYPSTMACSSELISPAQLFNLIGRGVTCNNKEIPIDAFLSSAQLTVGGPFLASAICLVLALITQQKKVGGPSNAAQD